MKHASDYHRNSDKPQPLIDYCFDTIIIAFTHLNGTQRLQRLACSWQEEVIDRQQVHAQRKDEDVCAASSGEDNLVSTE